MTLADAPATSCQTFKARIGPQRFSATVGLSQRFHCKLPTLCFRTVMATQSPTTGTVGPGGIVILDPPAAPLLIPMDGGVILRGAPRSAIGDAIAGVPFVA